MRCARATNSSRRSRTFRSFFCLWRLRGRGNIGATRRRVGRRATVGNEDQGVRVSPHAGIAGFGDTGARNKNLAARRRRLRVRAPHRHRCSCKCLHRQAAPTPQPSAANDPNHSVLDRHCIEPHSAAESPRGRHIRRSLPAGCSGPHSQATNAFLSAALTKLLTLAAVRSVPAKLDLSAVSKHDAGCWHTTLSESLLTLGLDSEFNNLRDERALPHELSNILFHSASSEFG